jgi:hypothetical protein
VIAAAGGLIVFLSLFLKWYGVEDESRKGWEIFSFVDIVLTICALVAIAAAVVSFMRVALPVALDGVLFGVGLLATILVFIFMIEFTSGEFFAELGLKVGAYLALLAALAMAFGGYLVKNPAAFGGLGARQIGGPAGVGAGAGYGAPGAPGAGTAGPLGGGGAAPAPTPAPAEPRTEAQPPAGAGAAAAGGGQPAGWYADPKGEKRLRYWDGTGWTDQTAD